MPINPLEDRLAVCSWSLHPTGVDDLIDQLNQLGISKTQLALRPLYVEGSGWDDTRQKFQDAGITIVSGMFGTVGENYATLDTIRQTGGVVPDDTWDQNLEIVKNTARVAGELELDLCTFHAGFLPPDPEAEVYDRLTQRINTIADIFTDVGVMVGFETGQEEATTLKAFLERLGRDDVGVNFDPANMILYSKGDPVESVQTLMPYMKQIHLKDATHADTPGTWGKEVAVGTGDVDWKHFFAAIKEAGYTGHFAIEREAGDQRIPDITAAKEFLLSTYDAA